MNTNVTKMAIQIIKFFKDFVKMFRLASFILIGSQVETPGLLLRVKHTVKLQAYSQLLFFRVTL